MTKREEARQKKAQARCDLWTHPEGTKVTVRFDNGHVVETETRSMPWVLCGEPVILVRGIAGGYNLDRVTVVP